MQIAQEYGNIKKKNKPENETKVRLSIFKKRVLITRVWEIVNFTSKEKYHIILVSYPKSNNF